MVSERKTTLKKFGNFWAKSKFKI